ncbi:MAG: molecular chaperone DnaJ [Deltaproteobacteria bacterium]|nr:MAG: molecular chaperone DnaJ [Deltaproteobacteria bacterium]
MADAHAQFVQRIAQWLKALDHLDYYQVLQVDPKASQGEIRKAYHRQSRLFHPDRYFHMEDEKLKRAIYKISKRVTEAYVTLRDPQKRRFYDKQLAESGRKLLRYTEQSEQRTKEEKKQQFAKTAKGRQLYQQGMRQLKQKDYVGAERTFKMALAYEPDNELFKQLAEEAGKNIKTDYRIK